MKKGFTLIELIVSFVLITVLSIALFKTVINIQKKQLENIEINQFKAFTYILNSTINYDFLNGKIESVNKCATGSTNCYKIKFENREIIELSIDRVNNTIKYGNIKEKLPNEYFFVDNIQIVKYQSSTNGLNSYIFLEIPIKSKLETNFSSLKYMYQYDSVKDNSISFNIT